MNKTKSKMKCSKPSKLVADVFMIDCMMFLFGTDRFIVSLLNLEDSQFKFTKKMRTFHGSVNDLEECHCEICAPYGVWVWLPLLERWWLNPAVGSVLQPRLDIEEGTVVERRESATDPPPINSPATREEAVSSPPSNSPATREGPSSSPQQLLRIVARTLAPVSQPRRGRQRRSRYLKRRQARSVARRLIRQLYRA